jgi:hypothetical protein
MFVLCGSVKFRGLRHRSSKWHNRSSCRLGRSLIGEGCVCLLCVSVELRGVKHRSSSVWQLEGAVSSNEGCPPLMLCCAWCQYQTVRP